MGGKLIIFGLWLLGFILGFIGFFVLPSIGSWLMDFLPEIWKNRTLLGALFSGIAGSLITTISVALWAKLSR